MLKKILLASAILASTVGVAVANPAPYVGASVGVTNNYLNGKVNGTNFNFAGYRGVPFNLFAGYGGVVSDTFYLAGELSATLATADISDNNGLKTTYGYGVSVLPGVMLNNSTLGFARLGVTRAHFSGADENRNGGVFGLGLQTSVTQNVDIRGEYDFVAYRSMSATAAGTKVSLSPRADQFTLGLVYKIG